MPQRTKDTLDIRTLLHHLRAKSTERQISQDTGFARDTIRRYKKWAKEHQLLELPALPDEAHLQALLDKTLPLLMPPQNRSSVEPYADIVTELLGKHVEIAALCQRLKERGYTGSYSSVYRYVSRTQKKDPEVTLRIETPPGYEAQVDFGEVSRFTDPQNGQLRKTYVFVMVLSHSRSLYAELVFDQKAITWLAAHTRALAYFGGVPARIVLDNLKPGVIKAVWDHPEVNRSYAELAEHYGFLISPCRPATPQHKGKVESGVHFVQRNFCAGREPSTITQGNTDLLDWCRQAAHRIHGTTRKKPVELFEEVEKPALKPLPRQPYDLGIYKKVKLPPDFHVVFDNAYYSAPFRYVGHCLWARGGLQTVRILTEDHQVVATHDRLANPGDRSTLPGHAPAQKEEALPRTPASLREEAQTIGPRTLNAVEALLSHPNIDKSNSARRLLGLAKKHSAERLELACARALAYEDASYQTVRDILTKGLEGEPPPPAQAPFASVFVRSAEELFAQFGGVTRWM